jgi:hypothetical protein
MNYITHQALKDTIKDLKTTLKSNVDLVQVRQIIKTELTNLLGKENFKGGTYRGGMNKDEFLIYLEDIFGKKNFQNGKYQGGKEVIVEVVEELFGKTNFKDGKFTGG